MPRIPTKDYIENYRAINEERICIIRHCNSNRAGVGRYCSRHQRNKWRFGDPHARRIFPQEMDVERSKVWHVVEYNRDHQAIKGGIEYFRKWMENAANGIPGISAHEHFKRLHEEGVTGNELLVEAATVYMFQQYNPEALPGNLPDPLMMAIGLAVLGYRKMVEGDPNPRNYISELRITPRTRKEVGRIIWRDIGMLLVEIYKAIQENDKAKGLDRQLEAQLENVMS